MTLVPPADLTQAILDGSRTDFAFLIPEGYSLPSHADPGEIWLLAKSNHWIVVELNERMLVGEGSNSESTGLPYHCNGWAIANEILVRRPAGWSDGPGPLHFEINGYEHIYPVER